MYSQQKFVRFLNDFMKNYTLSLELAVGVYGAKYSRCYISEEIYESKAINHLRYHFRKIIFTKQLYKQIVFLNLTTIRVQLSALLTVLPTVGARGNKTQTLKLVLPVVE